MKIQIEDCYPADTSLMEQFEKLDEEKAEMEDAQSGIELAQEALDLATVAIGVADMAVDNLVHEEDKPIIEQSLKAWLKRKYKSKKGAE